MMIGGLGHGMILFKKVYPDILETGFPHFPAERVNMCFLGEANSSQHTQLS